MASFSISYIAPKHHKHLLISWNYAEGEAYISYDKTFSKVNLWDTKSYFFVPIDMRNDWYHLPFIKSPYEKMIQYMLVNLYNFE